MRITRNDEVKRPVKIIMERPERKDNDIDNAVLRLETCLGILIQRAQQLNNKTGNN